MCAVMAFVCGGLAQATTVTLQFDPMDIFNYATSDGTRLNQLGVARMISGNPSPTGRDYRTYNDATRDTGATAAKDLQSVADILTWSAFAGYQGASHVQLWLSDGSSVRNWGETIVQKLGTGLSASVNGEYDWTVNTTANPWVTGAEVVHYNTVLGGAGHQNALSSYHPAQELWTVTGDFYVDEDASGTYTAGDSDLMMGGLYPIWFSASFNNWHMLDDYGNDAWGSFVLEGTIMATVVPEPATLTLLGIALPALALLRKRRK